VAGAAEVGVTAADRSSYGRRRANADSDTDAEGESEGVTFLACFPTAGQDGTLDLVEG
jgi:hypothetical protein